MHVSAAEGWESAPWRSAHARQQLIGSASNLIHNYGGGMNSFTAPLNELRLALHKNCMGANDSRVCAHLPLSPTAKYKKLHELRLVTRIGRFYWNTTFCPMPIGDACTRKVASYESRVTSYKLQATSRTPSALRLFCGWQLGDCNL